MNKTEHTHVVVNKPHFRLGAVSGKDYKPGESGETFPVGAPITPTKDELRDFPDRFREPTATEAAPDLTRRERALAEREAALEAREAELSAKEAEGKIDDGAKVADAGKTDGKATAAGAKSSGK